MTAFLKGTVDSRVANEAACLTSGSYGEAPTPTEYRVQKLGETCEARMARVALAIDEEEDVDNDVADDAEYSPRVMPSPKVFI